MTTFKNGVERQIRVSCGCGNLEANAHMTAIAALKIAQSHAESHGHTCELFVQFVAPKGVTIDTPLVV